MPRVLSIVLMVCVMAGCSGNNLNESRVRELVDPAIHQDAMSPTWLGRVGTHCATDTKDHDVNLDPDSEPHMLAAKLGGLISATPDGKDYWQVSLTDKGKQAPHFDRPDVKRSEGNGCSRDAYFFTLATLEVSRVTSLEQTKDGWHTSFTMKWVPTEFGKGMVNNGEIISKLTPDQLSRMVVYSQRVLVHMPLDTNEWEDQGQTDITKGPDGKWVVGKVMPK